MQVNLHPASGHDFLFSAALPEGFAGAVLRGADVLTATDPRVGNIVQQEVSNSHYTIRLYLFDLIQPLQLDVFQPGAVLCSILAVKNNLEYQIEGLETLHLRHGQFALLHSNGRPGRLYFSNTRQHEFMEVSWTSEWLKKLTPQFEFLRSLFTPVVTRESFFLRPHPKPAGAMALDKIQQILNSPFDDATSRLMFESHTWEYLVLLLVASAKSSNERMRLTDREREILTIIGEEARTNHRGNFSIGELGRRANMSGTKLKNAIKEVLGTTLGRHRMKARMEEARELLLGGSLSVKQVSARVNYKNANSFAKQFKKHFGYLPTEVNRNQTS